MPVPGEVEENERLVRTFYESTAPGHRERLRAIQAPHVVYDMPERTTCVEPQSGPPDAFNLEPRRLAPGETLERWFRLVW